MPLLTASQDEEEILVFYTQKSPHMNYENVRLLKETDREATFIKCFEGSNALDFQLVSELGYRLQKDAKCEYVIVSNDTGFDAVVRYWTARKMPVSRLSGKECMRKLNHRKGLTLNTVQSEREAPNPNEAEEVPEQTDRSLEQETELSVPDLAAAEVTSTSGMQQNAGEPDREEAADARNRQIGEQNDTTERTLEQTENIVKNLCRCIGKDSLADFHNALVTFFGEEEGKELYQKMKGSPEWSLYWAGLPDCSQEEKFAIYCRLVFEVEDTAEDCPEDFASFLFKANGKRKNLNSLRAAMQGHYGKEKGMKYYSLIKTHIKIMNRM